MLQQNLETITIPNKRNMFTSDSFNNSQKLEAMPMSINKRLDFKLWCIHIYFQLWDGRRTDRKETKKNFLGKDITLYLYKGINMLHRHLCTLVKTN